MLRCLALKAKTEEMGDLVPTILGLKSPFPFRHYITLNEGLPRTFQAMILQKEYAYNIRIMSDFMRSAENLAWKVI